MKMRKMLALSMTAALAASMASVGVSAKEGVTVAPEDLKIGAIYIGDENEGYTAAHMAGIDEMQKALGLDDSQIIEKTLIGEDEACADAAYDLADQGC